MPVALLGLTHDELRRLAASWGQPAYRGSQLYHALYAERRWQFADLTNLPLSLRERLTAEASVNLPAIEKKYTASDATCRYLLRLADGQTIETVWLPEKKRQTICISTQAGCAAACRFCATAQLGLRRQLSAGEIVAQVLLALEDHRDALKAQTNVVLMGQGEPLLNYANVLRALRLLADPNGVNIAPRRITLSTVGIVPGIRRLAQEKLRPKLGVSLNATNDAVRTRIMPINKKYPIADLLTACREYPLRPRERLTFEYVLLADVNDSADDAHRLLNLLRGLRAKVNLIPWNPAPGLPFASPSEARLTEFHRILTEHGLLAFIRRSRGQEIGAACGQLASLAPPTLPAASAPSL